MPGRLERHARSKEDWGSPPARSAEVREAAAADPEPAKRPPGRKDTKRWCRGKPGREHIPVLVFTSHHTWGHLGTVCQWASRWNIRDYQLIWVCRHQEQCRECCKVFREPWDLAPEECPAYPGDPDQRDVAETEVARDRERRTVWRPRARLITGRQAYRKPKAAR